MNYQQTFIEDRKQEVFKSQVHEKKWHVFYTSPRAEKIAYEILTKRDYEVFLPVQKTLRIWKNRQKKIIYTPLFPSYIFINSFLHEVYNISRLPKIATFISSDNKPSFLSKKEIDLINKMLSMDQEITTLTDFLEGERVKVIFGPLAGHEGILLNQKGNNRFGIQLKEINHTVLIDINTLYLEKIR